MSPELRLSRAWSLSCTLLSRHDASAQTRCQSDRTRRVLSWMGLQYLMLGFLLDKGEPMLHDTNHDHILAWRANEM